MKRAWIGLILIAGCAPYTGAERALVNEARKGVKLVSEAEEVRQKQSDAIAAERRARLDEAFDSDVRERKSLDADWVIEQRRAYAGAMEALTAQSASNKTLGATTAQNLSDVDLALQKLGLMIDVQEHALDFKSLTTQEAK